MTWLTLSGKISSGFNAWMRQRGRIHFTEDACSDAVLEAAAELIRTDRRGTEYGAIRPGLAEYIDLLKVVTELYAGDHDGQRQALEEVSQFVRRKQGKVF